MPAKRRIGLLAGVVVLVAAAAHGALWWWAVTAMEREVAATLAAPPAAGWQASAGPLERGGWPLAATVALPGLAAAGPLGGVPGNILRWHAARMTVSIALLRPRTLVVELSGPQSLQLGPAPPVPVSAGEFRAEVPLEPGVPARAITIDATALTAGPPAGTLGVARLHIAAEQRPAALQGEPALTLAIAAHGIALPSAQAWPLGPTVERFLLDLAVTGPVPRQPDLALRAASWRDGGGAAEVRRLELAWGEVTLTGSATLALDAQLQPMGAATARLAGHAAALRALTASGLLAPRTAMAAGAVLGLMARPPAGGGAAVVEVPFSLQDRTLALGRIPLVRVPELVWHPPQ
ncbi:MAG: DUF2125 domain-containing protein [Acetobacteraceae bacterium]|nr:DUF2125 domain-containing protein [Acetobacteraceae bacterium]